MAILSTEKIENPIRNKKKISTSVLWRGFGIIWVSLMSFLLYNMVMNVGGLENES